MLGKDMINQAIKYFISQMSSKEKMQMLEGLSSKELVDMKDLISKVLEGREYNLETNDENYKTIKMKVLNREKDKINNELLLKVYANNLIVGVNKNSDFIIGAIDKSGNVCMLKSSQYSVEPYDSFIGNLCSDYKSLVGTWSEGAQNKGIILSSIKMCTQKEGLYELLPNEEIPEINALINMSFENQSAKYKNLIKSIMEIDGIEKTSKVK